MKIIKKLLPKSVRDLLTDPNAQLEDLHTDGEPQFNFLQMNGSQPSVHLGSSSSVNTLILSAGSKVGHTGAAIFLRGNNHATEPSDLIMSGGGTNRLVIDGATGDVEISTGTLTIGAITLPKVDGSDGQVLTTDGLGEVAWETIEPAGTDGQMQYNNGGAWGGSNVTYDDINGRIGIGVTNPATTLDVDGQINSDLAVTVNPIGSGRINLIGGDATHTGYIEWRKQDDTRLGFIGFDTANVTMKLENSADLVVSGGDVDISTGTLTIGAITLPKVDGSDGQVLTTDGLGVVTWETPSGGSSNVNDGTAANDIPAWNTGTSKYDPKTPAQIRTIINVEDGADVTDSANVGSAIGGTGEDTTPADTDKFAQTAGTTLAHTTWGTIKSLIISAVRTALGLGKMAAWDYTPTAAQTSTTTYTLLNGSGVTFQPVSSSSKIKYSFCFQMKGTNATATAHFKIQYNTGSWTDISTYDYRTIYNDDDVVTEKNETLIFTFDSWGTTSRDIRVVVRSYDGTGTHKFHETDTSDGGDTDKLVNAYGDITEFV